MMQRRTQKSSRLLLPIIFWEVNIYQAQLYMLRLEPCLMCTGAMYWSKLARVVWGADDEKNGHRHITEPNFPFSSEKQK
jgi:tRNA(Arg) A34 adenosine deaminase TadA